MSIAFISRQQIDCLSDHNSSILPIAGHAGGLPWFLSVRTGKWRISSWSKS